MPIGSHIVKKPVSLALAIRIDGQKEIMYLWNNQNKGSKFWQIETNWDRSASVSSGASGPWLRGSRGWSGSGSRGSGRMAGVKKQDDHGQEKKRCWTLETS